jgi:hypothetical protein
MGCESRLRNGESELGDLVARRHPPLDRIGRDRAREHDHVDSTVVLEEVNSYGTISLDTRHHSPSELGSPFLRPLAGVGPLRKLARQEMLDLVITPIPGLKRVRQVRAT